MLQLDTAALVLGSRAAGDDRIDVVQIPDGVLIVVADGAGGMGGGAAAAEAIVQGVRDAASRLGSAEVDPATLLSELDLRIQATGGQSTAVIAVVRSDGVSGASVGDSGALHCKNGDVDELTRGQRRKPLVGSGSAVPSGFEHLLWMGRYSSQPTACSSMRTGRVS